MKRFRNFMFVGILLVAVFMACMALGGCNSNAVKRGLGSPKEEVSGRFLCDDDYYHFETATDLETGVVYLLWRSGSSQSSVGGITVLVHEDGTPVISEEVAR